MKIFLRICQSKKFLVKNFAIAFRSFSPNLFMPIFVMALIYTCVWIPQSFAQELGDVVSPLIEASCLDCHADGSDTGLDLESLKFDLSDRHTFETWVKVFDRAGSGQMPPESEDRPDPKLLDAAIAGLQKELFTANRKSQLQSGRVSSKRLTKLEYGYTLRDLLLIEDNVTSNIPDEVSSEGFDTLGKTQRISSVHMASYLDAADRAIDAAIKVGEQPSSKFVLDFENSEFLNKFHDLEASQGGNISRKIEGGVVLFSDVDYLLSSQANGCQLMQNGVYKITSKVAAIQSRRPVTFKLVRKEPSGAATIIDAVDLVPGQTQVIETEAYFNESDTFYTSLEVKKGGLTLLYLTGSKDYKGPGLAVYEQQIEGPLYDSWPPLSTMNLVADVQDFDNREFEGDEAIENVRRTLKRLAPQVFRRPVGDDELQPFIGLVVEQQNDTSSEFTDLIRVPLRAMLTSPQFLMFDTGQDFDDYALASRLSYFFWKSLPDDELFEKAAAGKLHEKEVLRRQVDRMLADEKSNRFIEDFLGQWLMLSRINATTPDAVLYPEYDEILGQAMPQETELFFRALIDENLSVENLIDSDFTFVNRRLARHYRIKNVKGLKFQKVAIPDDSVRGGILTQAAILKTTANGTVTSPVTRGNFVLSNFLGTPPSPPPPGIGSIEPDTRGKTTIREILSAHREEESCNRCHQYIDPPGFALESFDPIGNYRKNYRASLTTNSFFGEKKTFQMGLPVDASGVDPEGNTFDGIKAYKSLLMENKEMMAKNFVEKLIAYSTGAEIEFADREVVQSILSQNRATHFRVKDLIHDIVASRLFLEK